MLNGKKLNKIVTLILAISILASSLSGIGIIAGASNTAKAMYYEVGVKGEGDVVSSSSSSYYGRMIFRFGGISNNNKHYVLSFDMKTEKGGVPWLFRWNAVKGNSSANHDVEPARVEGNRYFFYLDVNSTTAAGSDGILLFTMFMAEKSAGCVSNFELYETDSSYVKTGTENLADTYGDFTKWNKGNYTTKGDGYLELTDLMKNASGRVDTVASDYFDKKDAKMMYYKAASGEGRVIFRFPSNSSSTSNFCYKLSFDLKTTVGTAPTKFWGQDGKSEYVELVSVVGTKYTFNVKVPKINNSYANAFSMFFPAGSEGYISNIEMYRCDANFENVKSYNYAAVYGDFSVWTKEAQSDIKYVGSLQLAQNMDSETGKTEAIPADFFTKPIIQKKLQAMYYEVGVNGDTDVIDGSKYRGRMIFAIGGISNNNKHYVLSFDMKTTKGGVPWLFRWNAVKGNSAANHDVEPARVEGNRYFFYLYVNATTADGSDGILLFNMYFAQKSAGYISNFEMYEADSDYNVTGTENLADTFGDFKKWDKGSYSSGDGTLSLKELMKNDSGKVEEVTEDFFEVKDAKMLHYKTTSDGEGRMSFRFPTDSSASANFCYKLSFNLKTVSGDAPTKFWGHNGKSELVKKIDIDGTKYTINLEIPKIQNGYATDFSIFLPKNSEGYITNFEMYRCDSNFENTQSYNHAAAYGNFNVWTKDAQPEGRFVGSLNLIQNMDNVTGELTTIPDGFFDPVIDNTKPKAMYYEVGAKGSADIVDSASSKNFGRMRFKFAKLNKNTNYVLSFDMKTTVGAVPYRFWWSADAGWSSNSVLPVKVEGNRYTFNISLNSSTIKDGGYSAGNGLLIFNMFFAEKSAGYISNFELYQADGDFKITGTENLAAKFGDFKDWFKGKYGSGDGALELENLMNNITGRVDEVDADLFENKPAKMMKYKTSSTGEGRIAFRFPTDGESNTYYRLTFDLRTTVGDAPTKFWGHFGKDFYIEETSVNGTKYTFDFTVPKVSDGSDTDFSIFFPAGSEGYISNINMRLCNEYYENASVYNHAAAYGDFSVWTKETQPETAYVGSLNIIENMDDITGTLEDIPDGFFYLSGSEEDKEDVVAGEKRMIYYQGSNSDVQFHFPDVGADIKNYQLSFSIRDISYTPEVKGEGLEEIVSGNRWYQFYVLDGENKKNYVFPAEIDGDKYIFNLEFKGELRFGIFLRSKSGGQKGYISNMEMYETNKDGKITGTENIAAIYGDFSNWTRKMYAKGQPGGIIGKGKTGRLAEIPANYFVKAPEPVQKEKAAMILGTVKAGEFGQWVELDPNETYVFSAYFKKIVDTGISMSIRYNTGSSGTGRESILQTDATTVIDENTFFCTREFKVPSNAHVFENGKVRVFVMFHEGGLGSLAYIYKPSLVKKNEPDKQLFTNADFSQGLYGWRTAGLDEGVVRGGEFLSTVPTTVTTDGTTKTGGIVVVDYEDYFFLRDDNDSYFNEIGWAEGAVAPGKLIGSLVDIDGNALSNAKIVLSGKTKLTTKTDAEGNFAFNMIPVGKYELSVQLENGKKIVFGEEIEITEASSFVLNLEYNSFDDLMDFDFEETVTDESDKKPETSKDSEGSGNTIVLIVVISVVLISASILCIYLFKKRKVSK